jgi:hypothetical protein
MVHQTRPKGELGKSWSTRLDNVKNITSTRSERRI